MLLLTPFTLPVLPDQNRFCLNYNNFNINSNNKFFSLSKINPLKSIIHWLNKEQQSQHSNASGGVCCAATSASHAIVDDIAQASNGAGAKQYHNFDPSSTADIVSSILTSLSNPLILHSSLGLWRELNHQHEKYKITKHKIKQHIKNDNENNIKDICKLVASKYVSMHSSIFKTEKHLTSWVTALSATLVVLKFAADYILAAGLLISAAKSFAKVAQRLMQITNKALDVKYNSIQEKKCLETLNSLKANLAEFQQYLDNQPNNKIEVYQQLANLTQKISIAQRDKQRYPKLRKHFMQDIRLYALDALFWLANGSANLGMAITNFISASHGFPIAAILVLILGSTAGVIFSNNKLLTGRYAPGLTESENGAINNLSQADYSNFDLPKAEQEFDVYYELNKIFKHSSKTLNKPLKVKLKTNLALCGLKFLMFASFGTFADDIVALKRKFRAYKAKLYKVSDRQLIEWIQDINQAQITIDNSYKQTSQQIIAPALPILTEGSNSNNFHNELKQFSKANYVIKELTYNMAKFQSNRFNKLTCLTKSTLQSKNKWKTLKQNFKNTKFNQKDFVVREPYKNLINEGLISLESLQYYFTSGTCCIGNNEMENLIDEFYAKLNSLRKSNITKTKDMQQQINLSLPQLKQNYDNYLHKLEELNIPLEIIEKFKIEIQNCLLNIQTTPYSNINFFEYLTQELEKGQIHIFEYEQIKAGFKNLSEKAIRLNSNYQQIQNLGVLNTSILKEFKRSFTCMVKNFDNDNIYKTNFIELEKCSVNLNNAYINSIDEQQYLMYKTQFESLLREAVKSTFATAGKQYARRYMAHAANIIAFHQNPSLSKKVGQSLKYS